MNNKYVKELLEIDFIEEYNKKNLNNNKLKLKKNYILNSIKNLKENKLNINLSEIKINKNIIKLNLKNIIKDNILDLKKKTNNKIKISSKKRFRVKNINTSNNSNNSINNKIKKKIRIIKKLNQNKIKEILINSNSLNKSNNNQINLNINKLKNKNLKNKKNINKKILNYKDIYFNNKNEYKNNKIIKIIKKLINN